MNFADLLISVRGCIPSIKLVGIDPGQTTGVSVFQGDRLLLADQLNTGEVPPGAIITAAFLDKVQPEVIIMEEYRVYSWKTKSHAGSTLHTSRLIGAIEYIACIRGIPVIFQGAGEAKGFSTDEKLKKWGFYQIAKRHANDSIRHCCHALLFSKKVKYETSR